MITIEKVNKYFNRRKKNQIHVINNTNLIIKETGLVSILGQSGCGKTTLLNAIGGLDSVNSGKIYVNGKKISSKFSFKSDKIRNINIGYIFQDYKLIDDLSVFDNVALSLKIVGIKNKEEIKTRVNYCLEKLNIYRYRNRPASMLSGGERQRVGIARAIVKNPNIIIADEPTGNLDSKNSLEIMNVIKSISKDHLVLLVTHEANLAKFYSDRIIELEDGKVVKDYLNDHENELEYRIDNRIYLGDIDNYKEVKNKDYDMNIYSDNDRKVNLDIVIKNGNIYIKSDSNRIEVVDDNSSVELINDHYKNINKDSIDKYKFDESKLKNKKLRYSSIFNPITFITNGFLKVFDYSFLKKILLVGFFISGIFITYALSTIAASRDIRDGDYIRINKEYLNIEQKKISLDDYNNVKNTENVEYVISGSSIVNFDVKYDNYYQTSMSSDTLSGSLSNINMINNKDIIYGTNVINKNDIVVDKMCINKMFTNNYAIMAGIIKVKDMVNYKVSIPNVGDFNIVGIVDKNSPSIYTNQENFNNILYNYSREDGNSDEVVINDYNLFNDNYVLKSGKLPTNDYEVIVNISNKDNMPLNKTIHTKINNNKLTVVGYYESKNDKNYYLVNSNTLLIKLITTESDLTIKASDKDNVIEKLESEKYNISDSYTKARDKYFESKKDDNKTTFIVSSIIIGISLIEILLMMRSSFLSRIKEVGIYRAIGVKKRDIYTMFLGEIIAITILSSFPGILICSYVLKKLTGISILSRMFLINKSIVLTALLSVLLFNIVVGLLPVFNTIKHKPAKILARNDVD